MTVEHLDYDRASVRVTWQDNHEREFPSLWLFDNNPVNRDPRTGQRLIDVADSLLRPVRPRD